MTSLLPGFQTVLLISLQMVPWHVYLRCTNVQCTNVYLCLLITVPKWRFGNLKYKLIVRVLLCSASFWNNISDE